MIAEQESPEEAEFYRQFEAKAIPVLDAELAHHRKAGRTDDEIRALKDMQDVELDFRKRMAFAENLAIKKNNESEKP